MTQGVAADEEADVTGRHFGQFGGRYIPETLVQAHKQLEEVRPPGLPTRMCTGVVGGGKACSPCRDCD
jgi:hypothetical protein